VSASDEGAGRGVKAALHEALRAVRADLLGKLEGLDEVDRRRPLVPSGTNLLGLVKHLAGVEYGYLGEAFGRPPPQPLPWYADGSVWQNADMWATEEEGSDAIVGHYRRACAHADATLDALPLDAVGSVPWWPRERREATLAVLLTRTLVDTARHAGQADVVRELVDGRTSEDRDAVGDDAWWAAYLARVTAAAEAFGPPAD
jgi:uncharacterized damage-inducible protein DinB